MKFNLTNDGEGNFGEPNREKCFDCGKPNVKLISAGAAHPSATVCVNPFCWRYTNLAVVAGWKKA
jgi:hypothetical protein